MGLVAEERVAGRLYTPVKRASRGEPMGWIRELETGNVQACWRDGSGRVRTKTFPRDLRGGPKKAAKAHLATVETDQIRGVYVDPAAGRITLAGQWKRFT